MLDSLYICFWKTSRNRVLTSALYAALLRLHLIPLSIEPVIISSSTFANNFTQNSQLYLEVSQQNGNQLGVSSKENKGKTPGTEAQLTTNFLEQNIIVGDGCWGFYYEKIFYIQRPTKLLFL